DPARTIFVSPSAGSHCYDFEDDQVHCERAFFRTQYPGNFASCYADAFGHCAACGPAERSDGFCINTCEEGQPACHGDVSRSIFTGSSDTPACHLYDGDQTSCAKAFQLTDSDGGGVIASCWYDTVFDQCFGCSRDAQEAGSCVNSCPVCVGDLSSRTFF